MDENKIAEKDRKFLEDLALDWRAQEVLDDCHYRAQFHAEEIRALDPSDQRSLHDLFLEQAEARAYELEDSHSPADNALGRAIAAKIHEVSPK